MRRVLRPGIVVPIVISASLIGALLGVADARRVLAVVERLQPAYLLQFAAVMVAYEGARLLQWHLLLRHLGIRTELRSEAFAFAGGEVGRYAPMGALIQNYILRTIRHVSFSLSSAATGLTVVAEVAVAPAIALAVGVDAWPWLRPAIASALAGAAVFVLVVARTHATSRIERLLDSGGRARALRAGLARFLEGLSRFDDPRVLLVTALITACYVLLGGVGLWVVGLGVHADLGLRGAVAAYSIGVTLALVVPAFTDVGTLEVGSVGALVAMGIEPQVAVGVTLLDRALMIAASLVFGAFAALLFPDLVRAIRKS